MRFPSLSAALLATALLLSGCTTTALPPDLAARASRITVISALGDTADIQYVGLTVFNNEAVTLDIARWGIDEELAGEMQGLLARAGKEATAAPATPSLRRAVSASALESLSAEAAADLAAAGSRSGADLVLLLAKGSSPSCPTVGVRMTGLALCQRAVVVSGQLLVAPSSNVTLVAFDMKSGKVVATLGLSEHGLSVMDRSGVASTQDEFPPSIQEFGTERAQGALRRATTTLTKQNIAKGLRDLGLVKPQG